MTIYVHCPSNTFSGYVDPPWGPLPFSPTTQELADAEVFILVEVTPPAYTEATQNLVLLDPVEAPVGTWTQTWQVTAKTTQEQDDYTEATRRSDAIAAIKADTEVRQLLKATPTQIDNYIDTNVTDLAAAKDVLKRVARATAVIGQSLFDG